MDHITTRNPLLFVVGAPRLTDEVRQLAVCELTSAAQADLCCYLEQAGNMRRAELQLCADALRKRGHGVDVANLQLTSRAMLTALKDGESEKRKHYRAVCWAPQALTAEDKAELDSIAELEVQQDTPVRVLHRRAPLVRTRVRAAPAAIHIAMQSMQCSLPTPRCVCSALSLPCAQGCPKIIAR
jgi:hypothetical protein